MLAESSAPDGIHWTTFSSRRHPSGRALEAASCGGDFIAGDCARQAGSSAKVRQSRRRLTEIGKVGGRGVRSPSLGKLHLPEAGYDI